MVVGGRGNSTSNDIFLKFQRLLQIQGSHRDRIVYKNENGHAKIMEPEKLPKKIIEICDQSWNVANSARIYYDIVPFLLTLRNLASVQKICIIRPFPQNAPMQPSCRDETQETSFCKDWEP